MPVATLLSGFITRAKFSDKFDPIIVLHGGWLHDLHKAKSEKVPELANTHSLLKKAPDYWLDQGLTQNDWNFSNLFNEFTLFLIGRVNQHNWQDLDYSKRCELIKGGLYPHEISNTRIKNMIDDVDLALKNYASAYNPNYKNEE